MTHLKNQSQNQGQLRHPNVMTEAERLALPDPCRPIDERVTPARHTIELYLQKSPCLQTPSIKLNRVDCLHSSSEDSQTTYQTAKISKKSLQVHQSDMVDQLISDQTIDLRQFIKQQQQQANNTQTKHQSLPVPLSLLPRLVNDNSISLMKEVMRHYPYLAIMNRLSPSLKSQILSQSTQDTATDAQNLPSNSCQSPIKTAIKASAQLSTEQPSQASTSSDIATDECNPALLNIETKLYLMGQMYHIVLCIFLLCQCKSRKSLNPQITLQDLADAINQYTEAHRTELHFLTQHESLHIEPKHIELAVLAMDWQVGKQTDISKRTTMISSNNPLTGG